jgi:heme iron utilization protein
MPTGQRGETDGQSSTENRHGRPAEQASAPRNDRDQPRLEKALRASAAKVGARGGFNPRYALLLAGPDRLLDLDPDRHIFLLVRSQGRSPVKVPTASAVHLLHAAPFATLATQAINFPGHPYATPVPNVPDAAHCPLLLVSALAEHTKNLLADPKVSLSFVEPGATDVQASARLTLIGTAEGIDPDEALTARYLRYQPDAAQYLQLDFMFFRITPLRLRFIEGVGRMGWIEADDWAPLPALSTDAEQSALHSLASRLPEEFTVLGIDALGIDFRRAGERSRHPFPGPAATPAALASAVTLWVAGLA